METNHEDASSPIGIHRQEPATTITEYEYAATTVRALMVAEAAMASVNCGAVNVTRAQAEKLLDDYFTRVEQAIPWTEINPLDRRS
jgi:hypothetical protein